VEATRGQRIALLVALAALVGILLLLVASLDELELLPGKPLPKLSNQSEEDAPAGTPTTQPLLKSVRGVAFLFAIFYFLSVLAAAVFSLRFLRTLVRLIIPMTIVFLILWFALPYAPPPAPPMDSSGKAGGPPAPSAGVRGPEIPSVRASNWLVLLASIGGGALATGIVLAFFWKVYLAWAARRRRPNLLAELAESAGEAAAAIRSGRDPRDAVLRCYREMCEILSRHGQVRDIAPLTPRELTSLLRERGMGSDHAERLTAIFEEVRYGRRPSAPLADEATGCLEAIRHAYAGAQTG
jgi:hypothetical protein